MQGLVQKAALKRAQHRKGSSGIGDTSMDGSIEAAEEKRHAADGEGKLAGIKSQN